MRYTQQYNYTKSRKEDKKGCFNCKKPGHFIVDCPDLQKEKSKEKLKKSNLKSNKFRRQIKQSLMATWEDLDNESGSEKDEAKIPRTKLIESLKELLNHFETRSKELKELKERYVALLKLYESTVGYGKY